MEFSNAQIPFSQILLTGTDKQIHSINKEGNCKEIYESLRNCPLLIN